jgi:hypothetical protein
MLPQPHFDHDGHYALDVSTVYDPATPNVYLWGFVAPVAALLDGVAPTRALTPTWGQTDMPQIVYLWEPTPQHALTLELSTSMPTPYYFFVADEFVDDDCESQFPPGVGCPE